MTSSALKKTTALTVVYQGKTGTGLHVVADLWQCQHLNNLTFIEQTLRDAAMNIWCIP